MFCRTQWPSPEEYSQLEVQTSLGRTDIVRWFKDHRSALKNGETLEWMQDLSKTEQKVNNVQLSERQQCISIEALAAKVENNGENTTEHSKPLGHDKVQCLPERLEHGVADLSRTQLDKTSDNSADSGRWVKVTVALGEDPQAAATDSDILALEQPGRVTG